MNILFAPLGGYGHVLPALAIAEAARKRGHESAFIFHPKLAHSAPDGDLIRDAGFRYFPAPSLGSPTDLPGFTSPFRADSPASFGFFRPDTVEATVQAHEDAIREFRPDVMLADWQPNALVAAKALDVPLVTIDRADLPPETIRTVMGRLGGATLQKKIAPVLRPWPVARWYWGMLGELGAVTRVLNESLARRGLPRVASVFNALTTKTRIVPNPPQLDPRPADGDVHHVGHLLRDELTETPLPEWLSSYRHGAPLIYVTLGTYYQDAELLRGIVEAFRGGRYRLVVTAPLSQHPPADEEHIRFVEWVPPRKMAGEATVMVHHGGHGTLLTAVAAGTPSVTFAAGAAGRDVYARRLAQLGASIHVKNPNGGVLRSAVDTIMNDGSTLAATHRLAKAVAASGGPDAAVDVLAAKASYSAVTALH